MSNLFTNLNRYINKLNSPTHRENGNPTNPSIEALITRYESKIDELENKIDEMECEMSDLNAMLDCKAFWRPRKLETVEGIPVPRLQIELVKHDDWKWKWIYGIVYTHVIDGDILIPISGTTSSGGHKYDTFDTPEAVVAALPYRDGRHIWNEAEQLGIPVYVLAEGKYTHLEAHLNPYISPQ